MPAQGSEGPNVRDELARIKAEVDRGTTDLKALGFWRVVGRVKRDPALIDEFADEIGAIDRKAFEAHFKIRPPVWLGNVVLLAGTVAMFVLVAVARSLVIPQGGSCPVEGPGPGCPSHHSLVAGLLLLAAAGGLSVTVHDLAHWAVGSLRGIRFSSYFLDGPFRVQPGLKTDYASYLRAAPSARARMHAAGAIASKVAPFAVFAVAYILHVRYDWELFPPWSLWGMLAIGVVQIVTDVVWSTKRSDWKKYSRERALASGKG